MHIYIDKIFDFFLKNRLNLLKKLVFMIICRKLYTDLSADDLCSNNLKRMLRMLKNIYIKPLTCNITYKKCCF